MMSVRIGKKARKAALLLAVNLFFLVLCFMVLVPVLYAFSVSLHAGNSLLGSDFSFLPRQMTLANYRAVFVEEPILRWFSNSMLMAAAAVAVSLGTGIPAAYVFSRKRFPGRRVILRLLILLYAFPALLSMTALYKLLSPMGLINSRLGLIIVYTGTMAVFALWNMKGYFDTIPVEIEEAAMIDGARPVQIVMKIVLPLARPTIVVTGMMVLIYVWNEYIFAVNFMTGEDTFTLAAGLYSLQATEMSGSWPVFAAASIVVSIPILLIFFLLQKNMTTGLTSGGVKG
nr:ABC transporter permease subunit [uncultured Eisenbergiella sp.]